MRGTTPWQEYQYSLTIVTSHKCILCGTPLCFPVVGHGGIGGGADKARVRGHDGTKRGGRDPGECAVAVDGDVRRLMGGEGAGESADE